MKFTKVTYFVIGALDSYVKLYDLKLTSSADVPDAYATIMSSNITQVSGEGNYVYNDGTLTMNATGANGYSVKMNVNKTINPSQMAKMFMDVNSTADFNVSVELTSASGDATMKFNTEYFNAFNLEAAPTALPAGDWNVDVNLIGYYEWNGGAVTESVIKSVTVTMVGPGTLTMDALQASYAEAPVYVKDGAYTSGSLTGGDNPVMTGDVNGDNMITTIDARLTMVHAIGGTPLAGNALAAADMNGDGQITTIDARLMMLAALAN